MNIILACLLPKCNVIVSVDGGDALPVSYNLFQNYPNPFNPSTNIAFNLPGSAEARLEVIDLLGRSVETLIDSERMPAGRHSVKWNAENLRSGAYFYRLTAGSFVQARKLTLLK